MKAKTKASNAKLVPTHPLTLPRRSSMTFFLWLRCGRDGSEGGERVIANANKQHRRIADAKGL